MLANPSASLARFDENGVWPKRRTRILDWLITETRGERFLDNIFVEFCIRLRAAGVPIARATVHLRTHNPEWLGARILWRPGMTQAEFRRIEYDVVATEPYLNSPVSALFDNGSDGFRRKLDGDDAAPGPNYPIYEELRAEGYTDYVAWPMHYTQGKRHVVSFAADDPAGFADADIELLTELLPVLALVTEIRLKNRITRTLLETYVGPHASEQILNGATTRGSGVTVGAAILICDLRGFTSISEMWPRDDVIAWLNDYFDAVSEPIVRHGGEILKFIGDGMLAIFPLADPEAGVKLMKAVAEGQVAMEEVNRKRALKGLEALAFGVGVHVGDVMYGNIGSRTRLDFTVIGPAVNVAARLESLTKEVHRPVLFSAAFVALAKCSATLENIGRFPLRGLGEPLEVFAFKPDFVPAAMCSQVGAKDAGC